MPEPSAAPAAEFSVKDVARLFELQEARLRYWAQTGFVGPSVRRGGRFFYSFQDLIGVRVAKDLLGMGVWLQTVRRSLEALRAALPHIDRPLAQLRVISDGDRLVVASDDGPYEPASGQLVMSFAVAEMVGQVAEVVPLPTPAVENVAPTPSTAFACFAASGSAEPAEAERLLRRAVELDDGLAAAWTNLGTLYERRGARGEARSAFEKALALDGEQPEARYNLANLLADLGELELAVAEYRRVVATCPEFADAHYNLALALVQHGAAPAACLHLARYLELDPASEWADRARALLAELSPPAARQLR
jgi:tetratricopeptide (TPR) repeat protein